MVYDSGRTGIWRSPPFVTFKKPHKESIKTQETVAAITQLVEWLAVNQHVTGSSPVGGAYGPVAQSG
jgi:hypothetical protein